jgi:hypothetical protein
MRTAAVVFLAVLGAVTLPGQLFAQGQGQNPVAQEIRQTIQAGYAYSAENLKTQPNGYSASGSQEFWSSGGMRNSVPTDAPGPDYVSFNMVPKHIAVIPMGEDYATAMYYVEGSYQEVGADPVSHYFTRAMEVYVKEEGEWKIRAAHWSPVVGGTGTAQTAVVR